jgi:tetrathionate reductase subunit C
MLPLLFVLTAFGGAIGMVHLLQRLLHVASAASTRRLNTVLAGTQIAVLVANAAWLVLGATGMSASGTQAWSQLADIPAWRLAALWAGFVTLLTLALALARPTRGVLSGLLALHSAWMIRWTLLIGGQGISRVGEGYVPYELPLGYDGLLGLLGIAGLWLALYVVLTSILPWDQRAGAQGVSS